MVFVNDLFYFLCRTVTPIHDEEPLKISTRHFEKTYLQSLDKALDIII